jgi:glycosyltransferase involved in cell wall biosynthesis
MDDARRESTERGERPVADIFLLEERLKCRALDFSWLETRCAREPLTRLLRKTVGWSAALAVRALPALRKAEAVYCSGEDVGLPLGVLLALSRRPTVVMRMEQPLYGSSKLKRSLWTALLRTSLLRIDTVLCRTRAHVAFLASLGYSRAIFTPETTDPAFWNSLSQKDTLSRGLGEGESEATQLQALRVRVLSAGLEERDYETLIRAVEGTEWRLTIAAGSPWSKFAFASDAPPPNVCVGKFSQSELREKYAAADIVVLAVNPTERACGMNVVLEAWAMGVPVIATDTPGLRSYLRDGENALLVPPRSPEALRDALKKLRADPKLSDQLAKNGKRCIESWGNLTSYVSVVERALQVPSSASCAKSPASIS